MSALIRQDNSAKSVLIFTVHKAASSFLTRLASRVTLRLQMEHHSISSENYDHISKTGWKKYIGEGGRGGCFGPIRLGAAEPSIPDDLDRYSVVVHMRDPRDVMTSLFFSHVYSHKRGLFNPDDGARMKWEAGGIDRFVLDRCGEGAYSFKSRYELFCRKLSGREDVLVLRYEDMVLDYGTWLRQFLTVFSGWAEKELSPGKEEGTGRSLSGLHRQFHKKFKDEFVVPAEDIYRHKRQVLPGDHRRKLKPETVAELNSIFAESLHLLGYDT